MSVQPQPWPPPAPEIVAAVAVMYRGKRQRPLPVMVRDQLGEWLADEQFAGAYGVRGKPGWPPSRLALVTIFQMAEDLTDRQATPATAWVTGRRALRFMPTPRWGQNSPTKHAPKLSRWGQR